MGESRKDIPRISFPTSLFFHLTISQSAESAEPEEIRLADLKAIFFVNAFDGNPHYSERKEFAEGDSPKGRKVEVAFADGEIIQGSVLGYNPKEIGFFLFPADPNSNNLRAFVVNKAVNKFRYLGSEQSPTSTSAQASTRTPASSDYQVLLPETWGKLLMLSGEERTLLALILARVMETDSGREYIIEKLGKRYLKIAYDLLKEMERG
jgi:hypothetical protein